MEEGELKRNKEKKDRKERGKDIRVLDNLDADVRKHVNRWCQWVIPIVGESEKAWSKWGDNWAMMLRE